MGRIVVLGEATAVAGYALAGAVVLPADDEAAVRAAWLTIEDDVEVVVLTARAAQVLGSPPAATCRPLRVVMPR